MEGGVTWSKNSFVTDCLPQLAEPASFSLAAIRTNDFCSESLQQWDKHPIEEKKTELEKENEMPQLLINSCFPTQQGC